MRACVDVSTYVYIIYRSNDVLLLNYTLFLSFFKWHCGRELFQLLLEFSASN